MNSSPGCAGTRGRSAPGVHHTHLVASVDQLGAATALVTLERVTWRGPDAAEQGVLAELRAGSTRLRWDPAARQVALAEVWGALNAWKLRLDKTAEAELVTLVAHRTPASRLGLPEQAPPGYSSELQRTRWPAGAGSSSTLPR